MANGFITAGSSLIILGGGRTASLDIINDDFVADVINRHR